MVKDRIYEEIGVPVLNLEGDMTDERNYFPEQASAKLDTFVEIMTEKALNCH